VDGVEGALGFIAAAINPRQSDHLPAGGNDTRMLALEDLCSVLELPTQSKYDGTIDRVARQARPLSTAPDQDITTIICRALFAWLIADGDMTAQGRSARREEVR
jgi:ABC-type cobalamin transport system ATPase subunit